MSDAPFKMATVLTAQQLANRSGPEDRSRYETFIDESLNEAERRGELQQLLEFIGERHGPERKVPSWLN